MRHNEPLLDTFFYIIIKWVDESWWILILNNKKIIDFLIILLIIWIKMSWYMKMYEALILLLFLI